tara:strand:+ start:1279 stop:1878 length:600 start_codon:yes stop_codon:yes gene_type:complete
MSYYTCVDCFVNKAKSFIEEIEQMEDYGLGVNTYFKSMRQALYIMKCNITKKKIENAYGLYSADRSICAYLEMIINWCNGWEEPPVEWIEMNKDRTGKISYIVGDAYKRYSKFYESYKRYEVVVSPYTDEEEQMAYDLIRDEPWIQYTMDSMEDYWQDELEDCENSYSTLVIGYAFHTHRSRAYLREINPVIPQDTLHR